MINHLFIIVPSFTPAGPVKGAVALANSLASERNVSLVSLKGGAGFNMPVDSSVRLIDLSQEGHFFRRVARYRRYLSEVGNADQVASISFTFSADMANALSRGLATICSSVRGNLVQNYKMDYGWRGVFLAKFHLFSLRFFGKVVVMTDAMRENVQPYVKTTPIKIPNFIDELAINHYRKIVETSDDIKFVFVGSLTNRKQPILLIRALHKLISDGYNVRLDIVGDGNLQGDVNSEISKLKLNSYVVLHGQMENPYPVIAAAHVFVLPSLSEGLSRASIEALHLGLPCVMRQVDGNEELIRQGDNGYLFKNNEDLPSAMLSAMKLVKKEGGVRNSLLPDQCRQSYAAFKYLLAVEEV